MMSINERLKTIIEEQYNGNKRAFSIAIGVTPTVIENVVGSRQGKPSFDVLEKICANANISPAWLLMGEGDMLKSKCTPSDPNGDNSPVCHDEDKNNTPTNQVFIAEIVEKLLATIKEKDDKIAEQAAYIGRLEERIRQMTVVKEKHVADAPIAGIANAG